METRIERHANQGFSPIPVGASYDQLQERASMPDKDWVIRDLINEVTHLREANLVNRDRIIEIEQAACRLIEKLGQDCEVAIERLHLKVLNEVSESLQEGKKAKL